MVKEYLWYQASLLFTQLTNARDINVAEDIIRQNGITDLQKVRYIEENVKYFYDRIFVDTSIGISKVSAHLFRNRIEDRARIAELFRRLNNGGTRLSNYDLIFSSLVGIDNDMESFFETLETRYSSIGITKPVIIRLLYVLTDQPTKNEDSMTQEEAEFIATNRVRIGKTLEALKKFLEFSNHASWFNVNGKSVIPLYFLAYHIFYKSCSDDELPNIFDNHDTNNSDFNNMLKWLKVSLLNRVFSYGCGWRASTTGMTRIHRIMKANKAQSFPIDELFNLYKDKLSRFIPDDKRKITSNVLALFDEDYMFHLIYGVPQSSVREEDQDHIHPRSILESKGTDSRKIDSFGNLQLLDKDTNRNGKRAQEFGYWIKTGGVSEDNLPGYLEKHLIPEDASLWYSDKFDDFLKVRLQMIADKIKASL